LTHRLSLRSQLCSHRCSQLWKNSPGGKETAKQRAYHHQAHSNHPSADDDKLTDSRELDWRASRPAEQTLPLWRIQMKIERTVLIAQLADFAH
jgi:hypothetical protein